MAAQKMFLFFPLTRCWLKFWEEGLVEIRMLNGNNVLLLTKCEVWERGGIFNQICDQQRNGASFLWFHSLYQAAVERIFLSFLELQSTLESLLVFLVLCVCETVPCLQVNFRLAANALWISRSVWLWLEVLPLGSPKAH